ncbi:MAG: zinc-ribbon domain-containing protein [Lachnospiraceae bacterium]|nr:zinc-ribbon domain-containing protein [Lachnospiraceae bacterium]
MRYNSCRISYRRIFVRALINCPECGKQVSDKASSCPNCGCPIANSPTTVKIRCLSDDRHVKRMK